MIEKIITTEYRKEFDCSQDDIDYLYLENWRIIAVFKEIEKKKDRVVYLFKRTLTVDKPVVEVNHET